LGSKLDLTSLAWPLLSSELKAKIKLRCPGATCIDALAKSLKGHNYLERHSVSKAFSKIIDDEPRWPLDAHLVQKQRFQHLLPLPATPTNADPWRLKEEELASKYGTKRPRDFTSQREYYWLSLDQILPRPSPFRQRLDLDWKGVDGLKLFSSSSMQAFMWRSTHGKLYGQSDLFRFKYVIDPDFCVHQKQNIVDLFTNCPCIQGLFANFGRHYKLQDPLTNAEMEVGVDTNLDQKKIMIK
jgi:hypothetical protein